MLGRQSQLDLKNKLTIMIRPLLTYTSVAWGYQAKTYLKRIQTVENVALRCAVDAPWFVRNADIFRDLEYTPVTEDIQERAKKLYAPCSRAWEPVDQRCDWLRSSRRSEAQEAEDLAPG